MRTFFVLFIILFLFSNIKAQVANKIDKLDVNQLKLPKESTLKATYIDATGQVKSSNISNTELGYLSGLTELLTTSLAGKANDSEVVKLTGNQSIDGVKTFTGKLVASSTVNGSIPCPVMTEVQRDAFTPVSGDCVYNSTTLKLNVFDGSVWKDVGGAGGISLWLTANPYNVNDIVIESDNIYRCLIAHTSGTFTTDLAAGKWSEVSSGLQSPVALADGGTGKSIIASAGSIVYADADSFELLSGVAGQVLQSNGASAPSFVNKSISAKSENNASVIAEELQVQNNLLTQVDTNKHLIESGNSNILVNPSFEHATFSTGWVNSVGTFTAESSILVHGKKSAKLVLSAQTMSLTQSSTLYASQFADGLQGLGSVRVKSDVALKVCSIQAGVVSASNCVDVVANNKWGLYKIPFILGATSNGISISSTGSVTGTVYIDDAFVGATDLTQNINACNDVSCETEFSAKISSTAVISGENLDWIDTCSVASSVYTCNFKAGTFNQNPNCSVLIAQQSVGQASKYVSSSGTQLIYRTTDGATATPSAVEIICQKQGSDFTNAKQLSNGNTYSSTNADTDWASCNFSTLAWQGFGTVTSPDIKCKRRGSDLLMRGRFTTGTVAALEARIPLPTWNGSALVGAGSGSIPVLSRVGNGIRDRSIIDSTKEFSVLSGAGYSYLNISAAEYAVASNPFTPLTGSGIFFNTQLVDFSASIPIAGWENSNIIIGQFNGLESCASTLDCTDTFSATIDSAGNVSNENVNWINGNATKTTGIYTFTPVTGLTTLPMNCVVTETAIQTVSRVFAIRSVSSTSIVVGVKSAADGQTLVDNSFNLICQKQGADYVGKTAKAVASDQNVRSIGSTNVDIQSVYFGSGINCESACTSGDCTICNKVGGEITSVSFVGTGAYNINGIDGTKYNCSGSSLVGTSYGTVMHVINSSTSSLARILTGSGTTGANSARASVTCIGIP